jgi:hypothetical protein
VPERKPTANRPDPKIITDTEGRRHEFFKIEKIKDHRYMYRHLELLVFYEGYTDAENE